jgi:hypothetical protein
MPGRALPAPLAGDHRAGPRAAGRGVEARRNVAQGVYYPGLVSQPRPTLTTTSLSLSFIPYHTMLLTKSSQPGHRRRPASLFRTSLAL